jgi:Subtilase family
MRSIRGVAAALICVAVCPAVTRAQQPVDTMLFIQEGADVTVVAHLDSLGVMGASGVPHRIVVERLEAAGFPNAIVHPSGLVVAGLSLPADSAGELIERGRSLTDGSEDLESAGPLARVGDGAPPLAVTDRFIALFHDGVSRVRIDSLSSAHAVEFIEYSPFTDRLTHLRMRPGFEANVEAVVRAFELSPLTEWAFPDFVGGQRSAEVIPDDEFFGRQWHLKNGAGGVGDIAATYAWDITLGDSGVTIAVVELDGFEVDHPDLQPNLWDNPLETAAGATVGVDDDGNGLVDDLHGWNFGPCVTNTATCPGQNLATGDLSHGTAVAGLAAAVGDNTIGVTGVCPTCRLMLLTAGSPNLWGSVGAILYAVRMNADVINLSWYSYPFAPLVWVIEVATTSGRGGRGTPVVNATLNGDYDVCGSLPTIARIPEIIAVSQSNNLDVRVTQSGKGDCIRLLAPGAWEDSRWGITTTDVSGDGVYNAQSPASPPCPVAELPDLAYTACFGGASASAPQVAGTIGLMLSLNPLMTREEVTDVLIRSADKIACGLPPADNPMYGGVLACPLDPYSHSETYGYGRLNAFRAVQITSDELPGPGGDKRTGVEVGARLGWTEVIGSTDASLGGAPGSGPAGEAVFHLSWFSGGSATTPAQWMWEIQAGSRYRSTSSPPSSETSTVVALQGAYLLSPTDPSWYVGANSAVHNSAGTTDYALGGAVGYRLTPAPSLAVRAEARYRYWASRKQSEYGLAVGFGVMIN